MTSLASITEIRFINLSPNLSSGTSFNTTNCYCFTTTLPAPSQHPTVSEHRSHDLHHFSLNTARVLAVQLHCCKPQSCHLTS